ncbi:PEP-CTERM sorting domain-containing protein [Microseira sp. BLCC-F43]|uniref:PEP-CTERM sorting domain-containing protein n=1 Tax=Microseira sp. BLCC-F43 TaxID=3153602 RepID=UPI0035B73AFB
MDRRFFLIPGGELTRANFYLTDIGGQGIGSYMINFEENSSFSFSFFERFPYYPTSRGSGTWNYTLRKEPPSNSVPEPGTVFGLSMLGFGWLLRKKKASSHA